MKTLIISILFFTYSFSALSQINQKSMDLGSELFAKKEYQKSIAYYDSVIQLHPDSSALYALRGGVYYWIDDFQKAFIDCDRAITLDNTNFAAYYHRGLIYLNTQLPREAFNDFTKGIELNPNSAVAYNFRGIAFSDLNQPDKALDDFRKSIAIDPAIAETHFNKAIIHKEIGQVDSALYEYGKAIALDKTDIDPYINRGILRGGMSKDYSGAIEDFTNCLKIDPNHIQCLLNRGFTYIQLRNIELAKKDYRRVLEIDPKNQKAKNILSELEKL